VNQGSNANEIAVIVYLLQILTAFFFFGLSVFVIGGLEAESVEILLQISASLKYFLGLEG
jgi:hypothetical protein